MHHPTEENAGVVEIVVCRYEAKMGAPINPAPPVYANDTSSSPWAMGECKWAGGCVVVTWVRRTLSPLIPAAMIDPLPALPPPPPGALPPPYVDNVGPAPVGAAADAATPLETAQRDLQLQSGRLQHPAVSAGPPVAPVPQVAPLAPPPIAALPYYYHLPSYARPREPLPTQRNVTERGGVLPVTPLAAPGYQPPPVQSTPAPGVTIAGAGLLASAEVRPFGGPLPPSPLDFVPPGPPQDSTRMTALGAVPPVPPSVTPARPIEPPPRNQPQEANTAVSSRGATDPLGQSESVQVAPPRMVAPPTTPSHSPRDRALQPDSPASPAPTVELPPPPPPELDEPIPAEL